MPTLHYCAVKPYKAKQLFDLVNNISAYPEFIPHCVKSGILEDHGNVLIAFIEIAKAGIHKRFTTQNILINGEQIDIILIDGPFKHLNCSWKFAALSPFHCHITFYSHFEFKSKLLQQLLTPMLEEGIYNIVNRFSQRAKQIYSNQHHPSVKKLDNEYSYDKY